ncbi:MAG: hypothetical protein WCG47_22825 [Dermatophilaceae bacterium]
MSERARRAADQLLGLAKTDALAQLCSQLGIELMVLFGSAFANDDPNDVDLAVRFAPSVDADLLTLLDKLYQLTRYEGFDVLDLGRAGPLARERALVGGVPLHEARPGLFANSQIAAIMERLDTDEMRRVELALLAE